MILCLTETIGGRKMKKYEKPEMLIENLCADKPVADGNEVEIPSDDLMSNL